MNFFAFEAIGLMILLALIVFSVVLFAGRHFND